MVLAYPYTNRPGTRAAKMEPKVSTAAIARRAAIIYAMLVGKLYLNDFKRVKLARGNPFALPRVVDEEEIPTGEHQGSDKGPNVGRCAS
jgi:hypothetical protein